MICPQLVESGVYVLGALPPAQRLAYERHLTTCAECRAEVGDLAGMPGLLSRVDAAEITAGVPELPQAHVLSGALARVRRQRRVRRVAAFAVAAAFAAIALVAGVALPAGSTAAPRQTAAPLQTAVVAPMHAMQAVGAAGPITAQVRLTSVSGGTRIDMSCQYATTVQRRSYSGGGFSLYVVSRNGGNEQVGTWIAEPGDALTVPGMTKLALPEIGWVELRDAAGKTLLRYTATT